MSAAAYAALRRSSARSSRKERKRRIGAEMSALQDGQRETTGRRNHRLFQPDVRTYLGFLHQQIAQTNAVQHFVDAALQQNPDGANAAVMRLGASFGPDRMRRAMHVERRMLGGGDHFSHGDLLRRPRELIATARTTRARHDAGTAQLEHDLLDVIRRQTLMQGDLASRHWPVVESTSQVKGTDEAIFLSLIHI